MKNGITLKVLGDYGPFSSIGKSIGYQVTIGNSSYLIDCGAPLFQQIGGKTLKALRGLLVTHCHEDHKRWFSDLALYNLYSVVGGNKVFLLTSERISADIERSTGPALETSLSFDRSRVVDISYDSYVDYHPIGPKPKFRIVSVYEGDGRSILKVLDRNGHELGPETVKIFISPKSGRPRLLFRDPEYAEWIEPENFYPFSSNIFYEEDKNIFHDPEGFTIEAINAPVWHGLPSIGIKFSTGSETLIFSGDTAHDAVLWKRLASEKRPQKLGMSKDEFESARVLCGDINDYVERVWSGERLQEALNAFEDAVTVHDIAAKNSIVHTDYTALTDTVLKKDRTILTHSPDTMTSEWVLSKAEKVFQIKGGRFYEAVGEELFSFNADVYHKEDGRYYAGYRNDGGAYSVYDEGGVLGIAESGSTVRGQILYRVDMYEDIGGRYFPRLSGAGSDYRQREDGKVELTEVTGTGSSGRLVEDCRIFLRGAKTL